jgi:hypothetical protein
MSHITGEASSDRNDDLAAARKQSMETARRELDPATILQVRIYLHTSIRTFHAAMTVLSMAFMSAVVLTVTMRLTVYK